MPLRFYFRLRHFFDYCYLRRFSSPLHASAAADAALQCYADAALYRAIVYLRAATLRCFTPRLIRQRCRHYVLCRQLPCACFTLPRSLYVYFTRRHDLSLPMMFSAE